MSQPDLYYRVVAEYSPLSSGLLVTVWPLVQAARPSWDCPRLAPTGFAAPGVPLAGRKIWQGFQAWHLACHSARPAKPEIVPGPRPAPPRQLRMWASTPEKGSGFAGTRKLAEALLESWKTRVVYQEKEGGELVAIL